MAFSTEKLFDTYGGKVRIRVAGVLTDQNGVLLINHAGLNPENTWWSPAGGGISFGESVEEALVREFKEETGLTVKPLELLCVTEYVNQPLHAIELFFLVEKVSGELEKGFDPELDEYSQQILEVKHVTFEELRIIEDKHKHLLLRDVSSYEALLLKRGFLK